MRKLIPIEWNNQRIMTTKLVAECYETKEHNINKNFNEHKDRFIEGKHYFKLEGKELKDFKNFVTNSDLVSSKTPVLYLWTDKGLLRHAKILDNDKAWEVYEMLEDTYFKVKEKRYTLKEVSEEVKLEFIAFGCTANLLNLNEVSKLAGVEKIYDDHGISKAALPKYVKSKGVTKSATELLKKFNVGISATKFNKLMIEKGYLKELERRSTKNPDKPKKFKNLVNTKYGENQVNPKNPKETQPMYYEDKFEELLKELELK